MRPDGALLLSLVVAAAALLAPGCRGGRAPDSPGILGVSQAIASPLTGESREDTSREPAPASARGMWVWGTKKRLGDPSGTTNLLDSCRRAGLDEVYLSVNNGVLDDPRLEALMTALRGAGVRVEALMGDAPWYRPDARGPMRALIDDVARYNGGHPSARFAGVHLDIEPHQIPENRGDHRFLPALAEAIHEATSQGARRSLTTSADLPRFALDEQGPAFARTGARPFVMLYQLRDRSPAWLVSASGSVVDHTYAGVSGLPGGIVIGLRVEDYDADLSRELRALDDAHGGLPRYGGWAVHDEAKLRARMVP